MDANTFRDVKPPVELPFIFPFLYVGIIIGLVIAVVIFIYFWRKRTKKEVIQVVDLKSPQEIAREQMTALRQKNFLIQEKFKEYYFELSDIVRHYLEGQFELRAPEMTTEEFLISLRTSSKLSDDHKKQLKDFLISCDMVKFAKYAPTVNEGEEHFVLAERMIA